MSVERSVGEEQGRQVRVTAMERLLSRHRFTVDDYHAMSRAGILTEDDRVELLDGQIVKKMTIGRPHAGCVNRLTRLLVQRLGERAVVQVQNPIQLDGYSEPEPDISLLRPKEDFYAAAPPMPADVLLVIEVADASLDRDRLVKIPLYARAGIREVWIIDLPGRRIERFREPADDGYREVRRLDQGKLSPVEFPELEVGVAELLG